MKILVVDDHWTVRSGLRVTLEREGYEVFEACNGAEAISILDSLLPQLIISDILMPIIDGFMLCREVRRNPRSTHIPFLFHTATFTSADDERLALQVGGSAYVRKPVAPDVLLSIIRDLTDSAETVASPADNPLEIERKYAEALFRKLAEKSSALNDLRLFLDTEDRDWPTILRSIRRARGLKQSALGEMLGVDQSRVSRWEGGRECPNIGAQKILLEMMRT